jgi:hypothetical protein
VAAILNQMTGMDFRDIENGGSDADRQIEYRGWLSYLANYYSGTPMVHGTMASRRQ